MIRLLTLVAVVVTLAVIGSVATSYIVNTGLCLFDMHSDVYNGSACETVRYIESHWRVR